jgi:hypothetical protein
VAEDLCARKFILLALRRLVGIRRECADVDQPGNALIGSRGCNNCSAVLMPDENGRAADPSERSVDCRDVAFESVETVLGRDHFVPLGSPNENGTRWETVTWTGKPERASELGRS